MLQNVIESLLSPSTWKENSPIYHHDYARTFDMTCVGKALISYVFTGDSFSGDYWLADNKQDSDKMAEKIMELIKTKEDRMMVAQMLVDADNYMEFAPYYADLGQDEELEKQLAELREKYNGLDAYVEAAQLELAENLAEGYADVEDLIALFK